MRRTFLLAFLLGIVSAAGNGQTNKTLTEPLLVAPRKFKLLTTNVSYGGEDCSPRDKTDEVYSASSGVIKVGNSLWMGSDGIGIAVFDLGRKTWSRFDLKFSAVAGDHVGVDYADDNYVFVTRGEFPDATLHIYSVKQNRWLWLRAVSTALVREFGYTTEIVQVGVDHRFFAKQKYLPVDWTLMYPEITLSNNGESYLFERKFSETKTAFEISKAQLEQVFISHR